MYLEVVALGEVLMRRDMLRFADNLAVPAEGLMAAGVKVREAIELQFDSEGGHASGGWAPLKASTVAEKARKGLDPHILRATDRLKDSLTRKFDPDHIEELVGPDTLRIGSTVGYGAFHQTGTKRMPRRRPVALSEADKVAIMKAIQLTIVRGVSAAGGGAGAPISRSPSPRGGGDLGSIYEDIAAEFAAPQESAIPSLPIDRLGFGGSS